MSQRNRTIKVCNLPDCDKKTTGGRNVCEGHYSQIRNAKRYVLGQKCPKGHLLTMRNLGQKGYRRWCKDDHLESRRTNIAHGREVRARLASNSRSGYFHRLKNLLREDDDVLGKDDRPSAPWMLLRPKPHARAAWDKFNEALTEEKPKCVGNPADYADYTEQGEEPRPGQKPFPLESQARELCVDCPLFKLCGDFAKAEQPTAGIWAGVPWILDESNTTGYKGKRAYG